MSIKFYMFAGVSHLCVCACVRVQEAFDRTGRIINITVSPNDAHRPPRLLNYLTAPHVLVWSAATASSAVPGVFRPQALLVKDLDGSIRPESRGLEEDLFRRKKALICDI